jgi:3-phosphoshikimate 1-carboxyvinyltransferase
VTTAIHIHKLSTLSGTVQELPSSKSISNRALIMNALCDGQSELANLSNANDTVLMKRLLSSSGEVLDVEDAGTTMRFLTAYYAIKGQPKTLTCTERMKLRPIGILVDALRQLGAQIDYVEQNGFPPVRIRNFVGQKTNRLSIRGDISSQYISALMMVAPALPDGLTLVLEGKVGSRPYIDMTASLMRKFGVEVNVLDNELVIPPQVYSPCQYSIESDWSAASYWFAFTALAKNANLILPNITLRSLQGDRVIVDIMEQLGVIAEPRGNTLILSKKDSYNTLSWDFTHCPDLAQTVAVVCAAKGVHGTFTGLESLRIKETDRIKALQHELQKLGAHLHEDGDVWTLIPSDQLPENIPMINTYQDHRMAMAFAPLAALGDVTIERPDVVRKSYPTFWKDMSRLGFRQMESGGN